MRAPGYYRRSRKDTGIWAVSMVKNEVDIVEYSIRNLVEQGVDHLVVADNASTDGTGELLHDLSMELPLTVVTDHVVEYYQSHKMTRLARYACAAGAAWVIPFDADECWRAEGCGTVRNVLLAQPPEVGTVAGYYLHRVPHPSDDPAEPNPFLRVRHRVEAERVTKVAVRAHPLMRINAGNHTARVAGKRVPGLVIHHVPYRTMEQARRKLLQGRKAIEAAPRLPGGFGSHWRSIERTLRRLETWLSSELIEDPLPPAESR